MIREARYASGLTQADLAAASGTSQATLSAYERGTKVPSAATLSKVLAAAGWRLTAEPASRPVRTPRRAELERRGEVLAQVIDLAGQLPTWHSTELRYPQLASLLQS